MIGIEFELPNERQKYLDLLFDGIDTAEMGWALSLEAFGDNIHCRDQLFKLSDLLLLSNKEFRKMIALRKIYSTFIDLQGYIGEPQNSHLETYEEFLNSDCVLILLCYDVVYYEVYAKDQHLIQKIFENVKEQALKIQVLESKNDISRYRFTIG